MNRESGLIRGLVFWSMALAIVVIVLGAYTRLTDAGLGCPDWPGCYGQMTVPEGEQQIAAAEDAFPERALEPEKAWNEMIHRYFAGTLGLFILAIFILSVKHRAHHRPFKLPLLLLVIVTFQAALGMWTVTMMLMPVVVMGHLLGGFTTISLLLVLYLRLTPYRIPGGDSPIRPMYTAAMVGLIILIGQIALGGWTSANYAALACTQFPVCESNWYEQLSFVTAFDPISPESANYEFGVLSWAERMTIHVTHRFWAVVTALYLLWLGFKLISRSMSQLIKSAAWLMLFLLATQVSLGIANIWFTLPLAVAVAHNAVAACLLMSLIFICYSIYRKA